MLTYGYPVGILVRPDESNAILAAVIHLSRLQDQMRWLATLMPMAEVGHFDKMGFQWEGSRISLLEMMNVGEQVNNHMVLPSVFIEANLDVSPGILSIS